jgi:hypothetical protein
MRERSQMARDHKRVEKQIATIMEGHWIREDKWDVERWIADERWIVEVKSENLPRGLVSIWRILRDAWDQVTENRAQYGWPVYRRLVVYSPTGTGPMGSLAQWEENGRMRREPFRVWMEEHLPDLVDER